MSKLFLWGIVAFMVITFWKGEQQNQSVKNVSVPGTQIQTASTTDSLPKQSALVIESTAASHAAVDVDTYPEAPPYVREVDAGSESTYSYRVDGRNNQGEVVHGLVNTRGTSGSGYVRNDNRDLFWIETEWLDQGVLRASDKEGNTYTLTTSEVR
jgi:hypothetical protein